jgi:hypothetical protein
VGVSSAAGGGVQVGSSGTTDRGTPIIFLVPGGSIMAEFIVAIDHITYYAVQADDEVTTIDLVLEDQGLAISSETHDAYITEYERSEP